MKIAIVFNENFPGVVDPYQISVQGDLKLIPYHTDPIAEYESIAAHLRKSGFDAYIINIIDNIEIFFSDLELNKPDAVFNFVEIYRNITDQEMNFAGLLELLNIPYTGSPPRALGNCLNKITSKKILSAVGIKTPRYTYFEKPQKTYRTDLRYPLIIKPAKEDASIGIQNSAVVENYTQLKERIDFLFNDLKQPILIEEFIEGRELNVAILGDKEPEVLPISEIDFSEMPDHLPNIVSYEAKWIPQHESYQKTVPVCPADLAEEIRNKAKEIALRAFNVMECRDYCRVDMRLSQENKLHVLEVNPNPDLSEDAGFMRSMKSEGYSYKKALTTIIELAINRKCEN